MSDLSRLSTKTLKRLKRNDQKQLEKKQAVAARHALGTAYHTRASKEAATFEARIAEIDRALASRKE